MATFSLYDKTSSFGGIYVLFTVNRLQLLYYALIMPVFLVHPYMIWGIVAMALISQINLIILSKWLSSDFSANGYQGFVQVFGERLVRFFAFIGLLLILVKVTTVTLGYVEIVHQFIFPSMNPIWLILFIFLISCYGAAQGMETAIRFVVIAFLSTFWMIVFVFPFLFPPAASLRDLYPLIPTEWNMHSWKGLLFIWSSFSGPEYLICLVPWLNPKQNWLKYMTIANAISATEFLIVYVATLFFFGSNYLSVGKFPVTNLVRYLQSPVFERIDMILISLYMFAFVYVITILLLCFYGGACIILKRNDNQTSRTGFTVSCITIFVCMIIVNQWFWKEGSEQNIWLNLQIWLDALTYVSVPSLLLIALKLKRGV